MPSRLGPLRGKVVGDFATVTGRELQGVGVLGEGRVGSVRRLRMLGPDCLGDERRQSDQVQHLRYRRLLDEVRGHAHQRLAGRVLRTRPLRRNSGKASSPCATPGSNISQRSAASRARGAARMPLHRLGVRHPGFWPRRTGDGRRPPRETGHPARARPGQQSGRAGD